MANDRNGVERYFEAKSATGSGKKFWAIKLIGAVVHLRFGKVGTRGSNREQPHSNEHRAESEMQALIESKLKKGYVECLPQEAVSKPRPIDFTTSSFALPLAPPERNVATKPVPYTEERMLDVLGGVRAPVYKSFVLDDEHEPESTQFDSVFEFDENGDTRYHKLSVPIGLASEVILSTPLITEPDYERHLCELIWSILGGKVRKLNIHRILYNDELRVTTGLYNEKTGAQTEHKAIHVKLRSGEPIYRLYLRIGREFREASEKKTVEENAYVVEFE